MRHSSSTPALAPTSVCSSRTTSLQTKSKILFKNHIHNQLVVADNVVPCPFLSCGPNLTIHPSDSEFLDMSGDIKLFSRRVLARCKARITDDKVSAQNPRSRKRV
ncbi:hypothetical protein PAAG_05968 [Paracoccidioides lutzii Pb01]|uniref:Uncharacterized protein n=1 Tax=Paracoccidioides lutzii (strain ATCC MYA-826 / Pb01) TaxID=502779 RepID=C1H5C7_PARBA|nr:hypothetical protein PAAG_05968 [Paracoccidioides lutzii Pb01]EEH34921.2 hypothetical protein PAAG_05968 [Paracoccidioides lutzii Pb01]